MLRPFLLVGVGGSGGKTLRAIRQGLKAKLMQDGWTEGIPEAWQFLHVDSPIVQDGETFPADFLPSNDYLSLVPQGVNYADVYNSIKRYAGGKYIKDIEKPLPSPHDVTVPISLGAGAYRAIGRTLAVSSLKDIYARVKTSLDRMETASSDSQLASLSRHLGYEVKGKLEPTVMIISSIAGGSGAGMFLEVTEAVKSAAGKNWAENSFGILYAPDVFQEINNMTAIAPNALAAIAETMAGQWNNIPSEATQALYKSAGLIPMQTASSTIGPAFNYVIGRKNGQVDFGSQAGVYKAVATSLCTWMTDVRVQGEMMEFAIANRKSKALPLPDATGLKRNNQDAPPFSSIGYARVSLGMEKFVDYASERLAKEALETILKRHIVRDPGLKEKTEEQWKTFVADSTEGRFLSDSKLNELSEANNDVVDALVPPWDEPLAHFRNAIQAQVEQSVKPSGVDFSTWVQWISNSYAINLPHALSEVKNSRNDRIRDWVNTMPLHLTKVVAQYVSEEGLPVTVELVKRLIDQCKRASSELLEEKGRHRAEASQVQVYISSAMNVVSSQSAIAVNHPTVEEAYRAAQSCFALEAYADHKEAASELLSDFTENVLTPMLSELASSLATLSGRVNDTKLLDQRDNPYQEWPSFESSSVAQKYYPAPNEQLLINHLSYPVEFDNLVVQTVSDKAVDAKRRVVNELILGSLGVEALSHLEPNEVWAVINQSQIWVPKNRDHQYRQGAPSQAKFDFESDHMAYLEFARRWLNIKGRAFKNYLDQRIAAYLNPPNDKNEQTKRQAKFLKEFQAAIACADPLVEYDSGLLTKIHAPSAKDKSVVFSAIPIETSDPLYAALKNVLVTYNYWDDQKSAAWFQGASSAANVRYIDIFTQSSVPVHPMVMGSVMGPISENWESSKSKLDSRSNFLKWRRGRSLPESIPAHPEKWNQILRGWYVFRLLNQFKLERDEVTFEEQGPRVSAWIDAATGFAEFPFPLMTPKQAPVADMPGIILESLTVALVNCYTQKSIDPLLPYQRLMKLGGSTSQLDRELQQWIVKGKKLSDAAPDADPSRAGSSSDTFETRRNVCIAFFEDEKAKFEKSLEGLVEPLDVRSYPVSWEIRTEIVRALEDLVSSVRTIEVDDEL